jgi:hypothetical protein
MSDRALFFSILRRPEMRLVRLALLHLHLERGLDWQQIRELAVFCSAPGCWTMRTDRVLVVCLCPEKPDLSLFDFSSVFTHIASEDCRCDMCEAARDDGDEPIAPGDYRYYNRQQEESEDPA